MSEAEAKQLANNVWESARDKGDIVAECYRKLERRWMHYEKLKIPYEQAKQRYRNFKQYLEYTYEVQLGI